MPKRICPKCHNPLGSFDHYFCSFCANTLDGAQVLPVNVTRVVQYTAPTNARTVLLKKAVEQVHEKITPLLTKRNIFLSVSAVVLVVLAGAGAFYLSRLEKKNVSVPKEPATQVAAPVQLDQRAKKGMFGVDTIMENVPKDAVVLIEGFDYEWLSKLYLEDGAYKEEYLSIFNELFGDHFVLFATQKEEEWHWTAVFIPKDLGLLTGRLESLNVPQAKFKLVGDRFIVSTDEDIFQRVEESRNKTELNLALTPQFVTAKTKLAREGNLMVIFFSDDAKTALKEKSEELSSVKLSELVEQVLNSGYNELVISDK